MVKFYAKIKDTEIYFKFLSVFLEMQFHILARSPQVFGLRLWIRIWMEHSIDEQLAVYQI